MAASVGQATPRDSAGERFERRNERVGYRERLRFDEFRRARGSTYGGYGTGGYGGTGYGYETYGSGDVGTYPAAGTYGGDGSYGNAGSYGSTGTYASAGTYGGAGVYPAPGVYESELYAQGAGVSIGDAALCPLCRGAAGAKPLRRFRRWQQLRRRGVERCRPWSRPPDHSRERRHE